MNIPDETLDDFIACYQETFPEPLSRDDARDMFKRLVHFYEGLRDYVLALREEDRLLMPASNAFENEESGAP